MTSIREHIDTNISSYRNFIITLFVWVICFAAITSGVVLTYQWLESRGPEVRISFDQANGLIPGQSKIMNRGVQVGLVTSIKLDVEHERAIVYARLNSEVAKHVGFETQFWLVEPQIDFKKISNLNAIVSGNHIGMKPVPGRFSKDFIAIEDPDEDPKYKSGLRIIIRANELKGLSRNSPILFRGLQIGEIGRMDVSPDAKYITLTSYIYKSYKNLIRSNSYFVNVSGFHGGIKIFGESRIDMDSLSTLISGGIALKTPNIKAKPAKDDQIFNLVKVTQDN